MHQPLPSLLHATQQGARCMVKPPEKEKEKEKKWLLRGTKCEVVPLNYA